MKKRVIFIGNRINVFREIEKRPEVFDISKIFVVKNSFLSRYLDNKNQKYNEIKDKENLINDIQKEKYDYLISNGCPVILPISKLKKSSEKYINVHPSLLPDLKGIHPINGAYLFDRKLGATCHYMTDRVDAGEIIEQISIGNAINIDLDLAYRLSFKAEGDVFSKALENNFEPKSNYEIPVSKEYIYYSRKESDFYFDFNMEVNKIVKIIKAFSIESLKSRFIYNNMEFKVLNCEFIDLEYFNCEKEVFKDSEIIDIFNNNIIIKKDNRILYLKSIEGNIDSLKVGLVLKN